MGKQIHLTASDGAQIGAYRADPSGPARGSVVVLQEIFGVNRHIRSVTDRFADQGYLAVAPALFDRVRPDLELNYDDEGRSIGFATLKQTNTADVLKDIQAAIGEAAQGGKVAVVGYCWGGTLAFASACELTGIAAAVGYYGGGIAGMLEEAPTVPTMLHFGEKDAHIALSDVERIKAALPTLPVFTYPADHGFNCEDRQSYDKPSADLALSRTLSFLRDHIG